MSNKIPKFGSEIEDTDLESSDESYYKGGFKAGNKVIATEVNRALYNLSGTLTAILNTINGLSSKGVDYNESDLTSLSNLTNKISTDLKDIITGTEVKKATSATNATRATNVNDITNNDTGSNNHIKFTIGDKTYEKTIDNVSYATSAYRATNVNDITNNDTGSNNHIKFTIGEKYYEKTINNVSYATSAGSASSASNAAHVKVVNEDDGENDRIEMMIGDAEYIKTINNVGRAISADAADSLNINSTFYSVGLSSGWANLPGEMASGWYYVYSGNNSSYTDEFNMHGLVYLDLPTSGVRYCHLPTIIKPLNSDTQSSAQVQATLLWISCSYGTRRVYMMHGFGTTIGNSYNAWSGDMVYFRRANIVGSPRS